MPKENPAIVALIVDDHSIMRELLDSTLRTLEFKDIVHAKNAESALRLFPIKKPDMVFLDINMPDMSGLDVLKKMIELDKGIFITMVSAENTVDNVKEAIKCGAQGFIVKPYSQQKIIRIVNKYHST